MGDPAARFKPFHPSVKLAKSFRPRRGSCILGASSQVGQTIRAGGRPMRCKPILMGAVVMFWSVLGWAQQSNVTANLAATLGVPEMILHNGKIVTMDNTSFESQVGTIVQAIAIRGDRILARGLNAEMRALAGAPAPHIA